MSLNQQQQQQEEEQKSLPTTGSITVECTSSNNGVKSMTEELHSMLKVATQEYQEIITLQIEYWNRLRHLRKRGTKLNDFMHEVETVLRQSQHHIIVDSEQNGNGVE